MNWGFANQNLQLRAPSPITVSATLQKRPKPTTRNTTRDSFFFTLKIQSNFPHVLCLWGRQIDTQPRWRNLQTHWKGRHQKVLYGTFHCPENSKNQSTASQGFTLLQATLSSLGLQGWGSPLPSPIVDPCSLALILPSHLSSSSNPQRMRTCPGSLSPALPEHIPSPDQISPAP